MHVGLGRGHHDVRICPLAIDHPAALGETHRDFTLRIRAAGDVVDGIKQQFRTAVDHRLHRLERGIHRPAAIRLGILFAALVGNHQARMRRFSRFRTDLE